MDASGSGNRKRPRNISEDEVSEFTPLSKRINNLHINNSSNSFQTNEQVKADVHRSFVNEKLTDMECSSSRNIGSNVEADPQGWNSQYSPDLTPAENPHYYETNRMLYELYLERSRRTGPSSGQNHF